MRWVIYSQRAINIWHNYFEVENFNYLLKTKSTGNHMKHEKWEERASHFFQGRSPEKEAGVNRVYIGIANVTNVPF